MSPIVIPVGDPFHGNKRFPKKTGRVLAIDFDRTLHDIDHPIPGRRMGPPMQGAVEGMRQLAVRNELVIFTARGSSEHVEEWLRFYEIPFARVTNVKDATFDVILDDRAVRFQNWEQALQSVGA